MLNRIFIFLFLIQSFVFAQDIPQKPNPPRFVNDLVGGLLSQGEINQLEQKLKAYNDSTSTQVAIVIVKSVQPYDISEYAIKLGREWGIGQKGKNNGVVFLWAPGDRKIFIATGYGAEGGLTDAYSKRIIEQVVKPNFKQLRYYQGLDEATSSIFKYLSGEFDAEPTEEGDLGDAIFAIIFFIIIVFIILYVIGKISGGGKGGGGNRGGGMFIPYTTYTGWGTSSGGWSSGGGGSSGGGFDFGGGSFGGGGAGGDY
ncbi:MAG: TPM domain-containing protein [Emticicia sp.]|nr:TPM domain-containing protein [Emticicia sp.]